MNYRNVKELDVRTNGFPLIVNREDVTLTAISAAKLKRLWIYSVKLHTSGTNIFVLAYDT